MKNDYRFEIFYFVNHIYFWVQSKRACLLFNLANGIISTLEHARIDADEDLNDQIDVFFEYQKRDESEFLGHFDVNDNQAICQAIQLQVWNRNEKRYNWILFCWIS